MRAVPCPIGLYTQLRRPGASPAFTIFNPDGKGRSATALAVCRLPPPAQHGPANGEKPDPYPPSPALDGVAVDAVQHGRELSQPADHTQTGHCPRVPFHFDPRGAEPSFLLPLPSVRSRLLWANVSNRGFNCL